MLPAPQQTDRKEAIVKRAEAVVQYQHEAKQLAVIIYCHKEDVWLTRKNLNEQNHI